MNQEQYETVRKLHSTVLSVVAVVTIAVGVYIGLTIYYFDTSDWFTPESNAPVLEVHHNGTGQTVNKQLTVDAAELQGSIDASGLGYRQSIDNVGELFTTAELQGSEL